MNGSNIFVPIVFFVSIAVVIIMTARYRYLERMEAIRLGAQLLPSTPGKGSLLMGLILLATGIALGLSEPIVGDREMFVATLILVFLGGAFLLFYRLTEPDRKRAQQYFDEQKTASGKSENREPPAL